jgi:TRAP-type C4-dicarboxylate transport system permease small subunit
VAPLPESLADGKGGMVHHLERISKFLNDLVIWIAALLLVVMIGLTCGNIFLRIVWTPIQGTYELMGFFGAVVTAFALGYTQLHKGHTGIDVVVNLFSARTRRVVNSLNYSICMVFFAILGWRVAKWATTIWKTGEVTETLRIIFFPFTYAVAFGCFVLSLVLLVDFLKELVRGKGAE